MLNLSPYKQQLEELEPGHTIRMNHEDCPAGEDTRRRLYITRTHNNTGAIVAYCHNCQCSGYHHSNKHSVYRNDMHDEDTLRTETVLNSNHDIIPPSGLVTCYDDWPAAAKLWAHKRGLSGAQTTYYGIGIDPSTDRIYLPRYNVVGRNTGRRDLVGYQLRAYYLNDNDGPKYLTVQNPNHSPYTWLLGENGNGERSYCIVVEDLLSAIRIRRAVNENHRDGENHPDILVLYGVKVDPQLCYELSRQYRYITIWLDNDSDHVNEQRDLMDRTIRLYSPDVKVRKVQDNNDAKYLDLAYIYETLNELW